jgi:DNA-binding PadR family transcriptional regulator
MKHHHHSEKHHRGGPSHSGAIRHGEHPMGAPEHTGRFGADRGRARRSRRGDVRAGVLLLLESEPRNGYQIIRLLEERSQGAWRPSPGSIYPVLSQLEDEALIVAIETENGKRFTLSDQGRTYVNERREAFGVPWDAAAASVSEPRMELMHAMRQSAGAVRQIMHVGTEEQIKSAVAILRDARRSIYLILADESK